MSIAAVITPLEQATESGHGHLPDNFDKHIVELVGELFETIATDQFYPQLTDLLHSIVSFEEFAVLTFRAGMLPSSPYSRCSCNAEEACTAFIEGLYHESPLYNFCRNGGRGVRSVSQLRSANYRDTTFYKNYMKPSQLRDEAAFCIPGGGGTDYLICLGRGAKEFSPEEIKKLEQLASIVERAVVNHERLLTQKATEVIEYCTSLGTLESKLGSFVSTNLTERERQIVGYLIRGYSSKACARQLDISPSTERVHRKNIYRKLGVNSQSELLAAVFDALFT